MFRVPSSLVRLYFNKSGVDNRAWSIDFGGEAAEFEVGHVTVDAIGHSKYDPTITNPALPKAWIEFYDAEVVIDLHNSAASIS